MALKTKHATSDVGSGKSSRRPHLPEWLEKRRERYEKMWPGFFRRRQSVVKFWTTLESQVEDFESDFGFRLFGALENGLRLSGSKTQSISERRLVGRTISKNAYKLAELIRPTDVSGYIAGFPIDDPLQKIIHEPFQEELNKFIDQMISGGWISPKPEGREELFLRTGAKYAVWHLHRAMELLAKSGEEWAATPPKQGQLKGLRALRRSVLFEVSRYMITFTGSRRKLPR